MFWSHVSGMWLTMRAAPSGASASSLNREAGAKQIPSVIFILSDCVTISMLLVWVQVPKPDIRFEYSWFPYICYQEINRSLSFSSRLKFTKFCARQLPVNLHKMHVCLIHYFSLLLAGNLQIKNLLLRHIGVDGRIILKWKSERWHSCGLDWATLGQDNSGLMWWRWWTFGILEFLPLQNLPITFAIIHKSDSVREFYMLIYNIFGGSRDSAVGIAIGYGLDGLGVGVRVPVNSRMFFSPRRPDRLWGPPSLLSNGYQGLFFRG
jgi:hypothetical protein